MSNEPNYAYNPDDPHGFHEHGEHEHVIVPWQILLGVLLALFVFTGLTIFQSQFEKFAAGTWGWDIPGWVNIVLAMTIAVIKGTLVVLYFMQLRYDKGINVILFLFTIMAVWLFIMFTALDLKNRGEITEWRAGEITAGGTGVGFGGNGFAVGREDINKMSGPIYLKVKESHKAKYIEEFGIEAYNHELHAHHAAHGEPEEVSDAWTSRTRTGLTPGLFSTGVWEGLEDDHHDSHGGHDDHADGHGDAHAEDSHGDDGHGDEEHHEDDGGH